MGSFYGNIEEVEEVEEVQVEEVVARKGAKRRRRGSRYHYSVVQPGSLVLCRPSSVVEFDRDPSIPILRDRK